MTLAVLTAELRKLDPSPGAPRIIGVDGHAGAGKSTLAARLAVELGGAPIVHTDDLATHEEPFAWTARLARQVLVPLSGGRGAVHQVYDWTARAFTGERTVPAAPYVVLEGVGAGRLAVRPYLALLLWLEVAPAEARRRGLRRDGQELARFWTGWTRAEDAHFAADPTRPFADLLVHQEDSGTYRFEPGSARSPAAAPDDHTP
jgi:uridine kinase